VNLDKYLGEAGKHYLIELNLAFEGQPPSDLELFVTYMGGNVDATRLGGLPAGHPVKDGVILLPAR
jgi:hypothetical protein